jgi:alpha-L-arabinofuranosidase
MTTEMTTDVTTIAIDDSGAGTPISADLWGVFFEDLNHAADGGLSAELVQNRSFRYGPNPLPNAEGSGWHGLSHWRLDDPDRSVLTQAAVGAPARFSATASDVHLINSGFDGIPFVAGADYRFTVIARSVTGRPHGIRLALRQGARIRAQADAGAADTSWTHLEGVLTAPATFDGSLGLALSEPGDVELRFVSLFPVDTFRGRRNGLRRDLAEAIEALNPRFVRFPGGCLAHGYGLGNMYRWKSTIGPVEDREQQFNIWGYHQSMSLGYQEYFEFCEDIAAKPLPVVPAGVCCQNSPGGQHAVPDEEMDACIGDVLDLVEWANGGLDTEWGAVRARNGHPEPFGLEYLAIGNEDAQTDLFRDRFERIARAVRAAHPEIRIVGTSGPSSFGRDFEEGWAFARQLGIDVVDEHTYPSPRWFFENVDRYDAYPRQGPQVYLGEYASQGNTLLNALSEAAFMAGMERNGDVVRLASYAPLLAKSGRTQWVPDLVYFDNRSVMRTLNYHVQRMHRASSGDAALEVEVVDPPVFVRPRPTRTRVSVSAATGPVEVTSLSVAAGGAECLDLAGGERREVVEFGGVPDYEISGRFRIGEGADGFVVSFGDQGLGDWLDWSIGPWGALALFAHADGFRDDVVDRRPFTVADGDELDVRIRVRDAGDRVTCILDGEVVFDHVRPTPVEQRFVATAVRSSDARRIFVKIVNALPDARTVQLSSTGTQELRAVRRTELAGDDPTVGAAHRPAPFGPRDGDVPRFSSPFSVPPYSFTIVEVEEHLNHSDSRERGTR